MSGVLVIAETRRGELRETSLELVSAAAAVKDALGGRLVVAVIDHDPRRHVTALDVEGVDEIVLVASPEEHFEPQVAQAAVEALITAGEPALVLLGHTIDGMGLGPALAARAGLGFASDVVDLTWDDGVVARRGAFGDKLVAELEFPGKACTLLMLRPGAFEPAGGAGSAEVRESDVDLSGTAASRHVEFREAKVDDVDVTKADFLVALGRGVEERESIPRFEELAGRMGATLCVSRPLVDAGWVSSARQVGQSGRTVKPKVYLALGVSGAVQHLAGMQKADTIIAVNTDAEAPIFTVAHFGAVADLFAVADGLEQHFA